MRKAKNDELCRPHSRHSYFHNHFTIEHIILCHGFAQAHLYKKGISGFGSHQCARSPLKREEIFDHRFYFYPGVGIIWLKDKWFSSFFNRLFNYIEKSSYRHIPPLVAAAIKGSGSPYQNPFAAKESNSVYRFTGIANVQPILFRPFYSKCWCRHTV